MQLRSICQAAPTNMLCSSYLPYARAVSKARPSSTLSSKGPALDGLCVIGHVRFMFLFFGVLGGIDESRSPSADGDASALPRVMSGSRSASDAAGSPSSAERIFARFGERVPLEGASLLRSLPQNALMAG